ncbi:MAG: DUF302 domain-containing protein [Chitinophagales bacterium]
MSYSLGKKIGNIGFEKAIEKVTDALKTEGFGILNTIDMKTTLKNKIDKDVKPYMILGACNPNFAYEALQTEDKIGIFLPCSVIVKENDDKNIEVVVINPNVLGEVIGNPKLAPMMLELEQKMNNFLDLL